MSDVVAQRTVGLVWGSAEEVVAPVREQVWERSDQLVVESPFAAVGAGLWSEGRWLG